MTAEIQRRRLVNLQYARALFHQCRRQLRLANYRPGHVWYTFGVDGGPAYRFAERDEEKLAEYAGAGVGLIQVHHNWPGESRFLARDEQSMQRLVATCHRLKLQVTPYVSSGFFMRTHPLYRPEWSSGVFTPESSGDGDVCSVHNPGWRATVLNGLEHVLSHYGVDGLYNDSAGLWMVPWRPRPDDLPVFADSALWSESFDDFLGQISALCHRYGAFLSLHYGSYFLPRLRDGLCRYGYIGECVPHLDRLRENGRTYDPLVLLIPDWRFVPCDKEPEAQYAASVPHGMFPVLYGGVEVCPWWGAQKLVDETAARQQCSPTEARAAIEGRYFKYLGAMNRMIAHDAVLFSDILGDFRLYATLDPAFPRLTASLYVNDEFYLVLANDGEESVAVSLVSPFEDMIRGGVSTESRIAPKGLAILRRVADAPFRMAEQQQNWTPSDNPFIR